MIQIPGWTCPAIDQVRLLVMEHVQDEAVQLEAVLLLEELRVAHARLRIVASGRDSVKAAREVERMEARIDTLKEAR